jgi:hypothetical protein
MAGREAAARPENSRCGEEICMFPLGPSSQARALDMDMKAGMSRVSVDALIMTDIRPPFSLTDDDGRGIHGSV